MTEALLTGGPPPDVGKRPPKRHTNDGLRKLCGCSRRKWKTCEHAAYFNHKVPGGRDYRFSMDKEFGRHLTWEEAEKEALLIKAAIKDGAFKTRAEREAPAPPPPDTTVTTFRKLGELWLERRGKPETKDDTAKLNIIAAFVPPGQTTLGDLPATAVTEDMLEMFYVSLRDKGLANGTLNKYRNFLMPWLKWGLKKGYLTRHPIADSDIIKHASEKGAQRHRRLAPDVYDDKTGKLVEEGELRRLVRFASTWLRWLIVGAVETSMRFAEQQNVQWRDVSLPRRVIRVQAATCKTRTSRDVVISERLAAELAMMRTGPDGKDRDPLDYVWSDGTGRKLRSGCYKKAFNTCALKAHGYIPKWVKNGAFAPESLAALKAIDLDFRDLRHEAGSSLHEAGMPLHEVSAQLGHSDIKTTSTYLNATLVGRQASMRRVDEIRRPLQVGCKNSPIDPRPDCNDDDVVTPEPLVN